MDADGGEDSQFSMEPAEFEKMVTEIRNVEKALGKVSYMPNAGQIESRIYSRSLFVVKDIKAGEVITEDNVRSIRPSNGLHPKYYEIVLGKIATCDLKFGTPLKETYYK